MCKYCLFQLSSSSTYTNELSINLIKKLLFCKQKNNHKINSMYVYLSISLKCFKCFI